MDALSVLPAWAQWSAALGPLVVSAVAAGVAVAAVIIAKKTLDQRHVADARTHWWERTRWAIEQSLSRDPLTYEVGLALLDVQSESTLMRDEEYKLVRAAMDCIHADVPNRPDGDKADTVRYLVDDDGGDGYEHNEQ